MNKKSIKLKNYSEKNEFISLKKWIKLKKVQQHFINMFNFRISMSIFKYPKSKHKKPNWRL